MLSESDRCLKMVAAALEDEEKGIALYENAVAVCNLELATEIFQMLLAQERDHIKRLKAIYSSLQSGEAWSDLWKYENVEDEDLREFFEDQITQSVHKIKAKSGDLQTLEIGITMEQESIEFYENHLQNATDSLEREFLTFLIDQERVHFAVLQDLKLFFSDPESWFIEKERHAMDGA